MATTLLDQVKISPAIRTGAKYRTSETAEWVIPLKGDDAATTARIVVLIDGTATTAETANLNTHTLRIIHQILIKEQWQGRSLRNQVVYALERANKWLYDQAFEGHKVGRMGASILVALFTDRNGITVELLHVGTCRALLVRGGERYQLTVEHTRGADFAAKTGASTLSDWSPTRFLGAAPTVEVATNKAPLPGGQLIDRSEFQLDLRDRLLLCSVGVKPAAVEHFLPYMPESSSRTIAQELVGYRNESAIGNATAIVAARDGARRRLLPVLIVIAVLALAVLLFWPQLSQPSVEAWSQLAQMLGLQTSTPTSTTSLEPSSTPITTTVAMTTTVAPTVTITATTEPTATETQTVTPVPTASPTQTATATQTPTALGLDPLITPTSTATRRPTNTPVPTVTPTNTPVAQSTASPTVTPTLTVTIISTTVAAVLSNFTCEQDGASVLIKQAPESLSQAQSFVWEANCRLAAGYGFELGFWKQKGETESQAQSCVGAGVTQSQSIRPACFEIRGFGEYNWAVFLVETEPFEVVKRLSEVRLVRVERPITPDKPQPLGGDPEQDPDRPPSNPAP
jgi:serine/threonine protein phosphatase PrpC